MDTEIPNALWRVEGTQRPSEDSMRPEMEHSQNLVTPPRQEQRVPPLVLDLNHHARSTSFPTALESTQRSTLAINSAKVSPYPPYAYASHASAQSPLPQFTTPVTTVSSPFRAITSDSKCTTASPAPSKLRSHSQIIFRRLPQQLQRLDLVSWHPPQVNLSINTLDQASDLGRYQRKPAPQSPGVSPTKRAELAASVKTQNDSAGGEQRSSSPWWLSRRSHLDSGNALSLATKNPNPTAISTEFQSRGSAPPMVESSQLSQCWEVLPSPMTPRFRPPLTQLNLNGGVSMRQTSLAEPSELDRRSLPPLEALQSEAISDHLAATSQRCGPSISQSFSFPGAPSTWETLMDASQPVRSTDPPKQKQQSLYKTELCRSWEEKGHCDYGVKCQFAHGSKELRAVQRHPKWKTELCRTYWKYGSCPYAKRCCFIHEPVEAHASPGVALEGGKKSPLFARLRTPTSSDTDSDKGVECDNYAYRHQRASTDSIAVARGTLLSLSSHQDPALQVPALFSPSADL